MQWQACQCNNPPHPRSASRPPIQKHGRRLELELEPAARSWQRHWQPSRLVVAPGAAVAMACGACSRRRLAWSQAAGLVASTGREGSGAASSRRRASSLSPLATLNPDRRCPASCRRSPCEQSESSLNEAGAPVQATDRPIAIKSAAHLKDSSPPPIGRLCFFSRQDEAHIAQHWRRSTPKPDPSNKPNKEHAVDLRAPNSVSWRHLNAFEKLAAAGWTP